MNRNVRKVSMRSATALVAMAAIAMMLFALVPAMAMPGPTSGTVVGTVTDEDTGEPIEDARVTISYHGITRTDMTDANGKYSFNNVPLCFCLKNISVYKDGYEDQSKDVGVNKLTVVDFELEPAEGGSNKPNHGSITGTITDINNGEPIQGAKVLLEYHDVLRTEVTGADGKYRFDDVPECFCLKNLTVTKDGYMTETAEVAVGGVTVVDFQLIFMELEPFEGTVMGTVWDYHDRQPLEGARVELEYHGTIREVYTDANGEYRFDQVPECRCYKNVSVTLKGYLPETKQVSVSGETVVDFELTIEEQEPGPTMGKLSGAVTDAATGEPIEGALVTLKYHEVTRTALTDAKGAYAFDDVPICFCLKQVSASKDGYETAFDAVAVDEDTRLFLALEPKPTDPPKEEPPIKPDDGGTDSVPGVVGAKEGPLMSKGLAVTMAGIIGLSSLVGLVTFVLLSRRRSGEQVD